jgi:menaquinone-dependent protoporphyrinogen oxidase
MEKKILVAYATKYGATAEIAEKIGQVLNQSNLQTDILSVDRVNDLTPYSAVVLGSAVYIGNWRKEAVQFLQNNESSLSRVKVWLFSSGPTEKGGPKDLVEGWRLPKSLQPVVDRIKPCDIAVFHGYINLEKMNFVEKWMINQVKASPGDSRDWNAIAAWASSIAGELKKSE